MAEDKSVNDSTESAFTEIPTDPLIVEPSSEQPKLKTAFAVIIDDLGQVFVERDASLFTVPLEREVTLIEVRRYASEILMDLQAQAAAEYTIVRLGEVGKKKAEEA